MSSDVNYIDLFHGIGGFALGAHEAGMKFKNHLCSDIEPYCQKLYKLRFPDSIQLGDIIKIDCEELKEKYGNEWLLSGGFPCQDISIAGKGAGINGARSGLWFEYWRLIDGLRPRFAIMENVGMLIHRGLRDVLGSLAEIGYDAEWQDIRASDMGAPHRRERIWIVAFPIESGYRGEVGRVDGETICIQKKDWQERSECGVLVGADELEQGREARDIYQSADVADTTINSERRDKSWIRGRFSGSGKISRRNTNKKISHSDNQGLEGWPMPRDSGVIGTDGNEQSERQSEQHGGNYWSVEPDVGRLVDGLSGRVDRLKGLGNAIVPQIAQLLFEQIKPYIARQDAEPQAINCV